jgi:maltodextrin utilization protein YvdJ
MSADAKSSRLFGIAGVVMALCCLAGPAIVAAAAGAAIGNLLGIVAAALVALAGVLVLRRWQGSDSNGCR